MFRRFLRAISDEKAGGCVPVILGALILFSALIDLSGARQETYPAALASTDKLVLAELFRLKREFGDRIYAGLAAAEIPVIVFNEKHDFLVGARTPPPGWEVVGADDFYGQSYHRRPHDKSLQAFAVPQGRLWAASIGTIDHMNSGKSPFKIGRDFWASLAFHEIFHAFQAGQAPERFRAALEVYAFESRYPFRDEEFVSAWDAEGARLLEALRAPDEAEARRAAGEFIRMRGKRRLSAGLDAELVAFERELEWLEGMAKHAEILFYESAAAGTASADKTESPVMFRPSFLIHQADFARLGKVLGRQSGDLRFYLSGMAQARILDRLDPGWQKKNSLPGLNLEDVLFAALSHGNNGE